MSRVTTNSDEGANGFQGTMMGGRHEQASLRSRNTNNINGLSSSPRGNATLTSSNRIEKRKCASMQNEDVDGKPGTTAMNEADSNADTCYLGVNFVVLSYTNHTVDVYPYDTSYKPVKNIPIVSGATTCHTSGMVC